MLFEAKVAVAGTWDEVDDDVLEPVALPVTLRTKCDISPKPAGMVKLRKQHSGHCWAEQEHAKVPHWSKLTMLQGIMVLLYPVGQTAGHSDAFHELSVQEP